MPTQALDTSYLSRDNLRRTIRELQSENFVWVLPVFVIGGYLLLVNFRLFERVLYADVSALIMIVLPIVVWNTRKRYYTASIWLLVAASIGVGLVVSVMGPFQTLICILWLPVAILAIYAGVRASVLAAAATSTTILLIQREFGPYEPLAVIVALTAVWGSVGLIWLTTQPLRTAMAWYSSS
jgi:hypothetical protein